MSGNGRDGEGLLVGQVVLTSLLAAQGYCGVPDSDRD